jgi:hypothetical protein
MPESRPELSEERARWMRNRFIEMVQRTEEMSDELFRMREELNQVVDYLASFLGEQEEEED